MRTKLAWTARSTNDAVAELALRLRNLGLFAASLRRQSITRVGRTTFERALRAVWIHGVRFSVTQRDSGEPADNRVKP